MDLFINSNHCGGIASSYTSSTSRGILLSADTGAKFYHWDKQILTVIAVHHGTH